LTVKQAAVRLEVSQATVYALVAAGKLRCYRVGLGRGQIRITDEHIAEYLGKAETRLAEPQPQSAPRLKLKHITVR
jgi:excisionase family DNA binding protein